MVLGVEQRHDVEARQQQPVEHAHGGREILLGRAATMAATAASMAGERAPGRLNEAGWRGAAEVQRERCSAPGEGDAVHWPSIMSKSKLWRRRWY